MPPVEQHSNVIPFEQRLSLTERDVQSHARTLTAHNDQIAAINTERAVNVERDKNLNERLDRIDRALLESKNETARQINGIYKLGWWVLAAFGSAFCALLANFMFKGGFII